MEQTVFPPFTVTRTAIDQIEALGGFVKIDVIPGGCCGTTYRFSREQVARQDSVFGCPGAILAVTPGALAVLDGAKVDYNGRLNPARFRVLANPNTPERCPCNRSFGSPWPGRGCPDCQSREPMPWDD